jgi:hypothetical protein
MMNDKYFKMTFDDSDPEAIVCRRYDLKGFDRYALTWGKRITDWPKDVTLYYEEGHPEDFLGNALGWLVFSTKVKEIIRNQDGQAVQFLPITVVNTVTDAHLTNYVVANILRLIPALDKRRADYQEDPDYPEFPIILKVALKQESVTGVDIFRLKEQPSLVFVSERLRAVLMTADVSGFKFVQVPVF